MATRRRRVVWTPGAQAALKEAIEYVAADSPGNARELLARLLDTAASLTELGERGRRVSEHDSPFVREMLVRPYRLIYRVRDDTIEIIAVLHQRRSFERWRRGGS
jgi:plasmid stabilization system protein ParE